MVVKAFPIDADPRIAPLFVARDSAQLALNIAEGALASIPEVEGEIAAAIELGISAAGAAGRVGASVNGQRLAEGYVVLGAQPKTCVTFMPSGEICARF